MIQLPLGESDMMVTPVSRGRAGPHETAQDALLGTGFGAEDMWTVGNCRHQCPHEALEGFRDDVA